MRNIWMLTAANLRKNKSQTFSLLVFVLVAAMLLNIGLFITFNIGSFFDEQAESNHAPHFMGIYTAGVDSIEQGRTFMEGYPEVTEIETVNAIGGWSDYYLNDTENACYAVLSRIDERQKMDAPDLIGDSFPLTGDAIYVPYFLIQAGYNLGDPINLNISDVEFNFTVAGATEETMLGAQMNTFFRFYIADENFASMKERLPQSDLTLLSARLQTSKDAALFESAYKLNTSADGLVWGFSYDVAKSGRIAVPTIAAVIMMVLAIILLVISLIVIRFRIINSVEDSMVSIGTQKAVGYRSVQIISSITLQFSLTALLGGITGTGLAQALIPVIVKMFEPILALEWNPEFDISVAAVSVTAVLLTVALISCLSAQRINKLHPLAALRSGVKSHSFKKNRLDLDRTRGSLTFLLALKQLLRDKKQAASISVIVAAVTVASVVGVTLNYNMNERRDSFARSMFGELSDVKFQLNDGENGGDFKERLLERPEVRKASGYINGVPLIVDGTSASIIVAEDCSLLEGNMLVDGRYPAHDNEIALGALVSRITGKTPGDTAVVGDGENQKEYLVTGIIQLMEGNGYNGIMNGDGLRSFRPEFEFDAYNVYLNEGVDTMAFTDSVQAAEGDIFESVINIKNQVDSILDSASGIFAAVTTGIWAMTAFVIILVLYMVLKAAILRRRRELGIQKAVGFTTFQLMNQIALNMTPVILLGVAIGAVIGYFGVSPMVSAVMSGMGIARIQLVVPIAQVIAGCFALVILAYAVSMLTAWRIRKISAYALVTE